MKKKQYRICLQSLLSQDYDNYEVIAIDDSSTDKTLSIISELSEKNHRLIAVKAPSRAGRLGWKELGMLSRVPKIIWKNPFVY